MTTQEDTSLEPLSDQRRKWLQTAADTFHASLDRAAVQWLLGPRRGLTKEQVVSNRIGLVPSDCPGFEKFAGYLSIPFFAADGHVTSIRFRRPDWVSEAGPKYLNIDGERSRVYGVASVLGPWPEAHIAEGEFDSIILRDAFGCAVGYPGATFWEPHHRVFFEGFQKVYIHGDGDEAGRKFVHEMSNRLRNAVPVYYPTGQDATSVYVDGGADALRRLIPE